MRMHIGGQWVDKSEKVEVINPFNGSVIDTIPRASQRDVETALKTAEYGAKIMAKMTGYERYEIIHKVSEIMTERVEELAQIITLEEGKTLAEATIEI